MIYDIPTEIIVNGNTRAITNQGDYRMVLDCFSAINDVELSKDERIYASLIIFYEDFTDIEDLCLIPDEELEMLVIEMFKFFNCGQEQSPGAVSNQILVDWNQDAHLIFSAVNNVAGKEVRSESYMHWWTFMGFYLAVGESAFSTVVSIRDKIVKGKKLEKYEREFKQNNPQYFVWNSKTVQQREDDELLKQLWNTDV